MESFAWYEETGFAILVCDKEGIIRYMNKKACENNAAEGGIMLVGKNVLDCHPEHTKAKVRELFEKHITNVYTVEKKGIKKLIYQSPWYENGEFAGIYELSIPVPFDMPHFVRK
jgi:transcriptional regulator with PAS, ATPase and Fis domain